MNSAFCTLTFIVISFCNLASAQSATSSVALPGAKQTGPSCAFFANVPTVTQIFGVNIVDGSPASQQFVRSIYGLRKGDFKIQSSFDKSMFFSLFGIAAKPYEKYLSGTRVSLLLQETEQIIDEKIQPSLTGRTHISARVNGDMGRLHNILLVSWKDDRFRYHNPTTGKYYSCTKAQLAKKYSLNPHCSATRHAPAITSTS